MGKGQGRGGYNARGRYIGAGHNEQRLSSVSERVINALRSHDTSLGRKLANMVADGVRPEAIRSEAATMARFTRDAERSLGRLILSAERGSRSIPEAASGMRAEVSGIALGLKLLRQVGGAGDIDDVLAHAERVQRGGDSLNALRALRSDFRDNVASRVRIAALNVRRELAGTHQIRRRSA